MFSFAGTTSIIVPLVLIITFGVHFRIGSILIHLSFWNGVITDILKDIFALPRPFNVDAAVRLPGENLPNQTPFQGECARSFFGALPRHVVEYFRIQGVFVDGVQSFGLPSGHSSSAAALWGAIFLFFNKTWVKAVAIVFLVMIPLSRLYLGVHFLADVVSGFLLGIIILLVFYRLVYLNENWMQRLFEQKATVIRSLSGFTALFYFAVLPFLLLLIPDIEPLAAPSLFGLNGAFLLLWRQGMPKEGGTLLQRTARVILAVIFYFGIDLGLKGLSGLFFSPGNLPGILFFLRQAVAIFLLIWATTTVNIKLGLYKR